MWVTNMLSFILLILFLDWASKVQVGYKEVPLTKYDPEYYGYRSDNLDSVIEFYEQRNCGYLKMLDNDDKIGGEER